MKINDLLSVNCIILDKGIVEPDETILNATNKTEFCEYEINLNYNKKLINFPKNITQQQKIYFIFFIDEKFKEKFKENEIYEIQRLHSPKFLNYTLDVGVNTKETLIFLFDAEGNNGLFSLAKLKIQIYRYEIYEGRKNFYNINYVGEDKPIFGEYAYYPDYKAYFVIIDNYKEIK